MVRLMVEFAKPMLHCQSVRLVLTANSIYNLPDVLEIELRIAPHDAVPGCATVSPPLLNTMPVADASLALQTDVAIVSVRRDGERVGGEARRVA